MKERPLLMSAPVVRSTLRDLNPKTQTRRVCKQDVRAGMPEPEWQSLLKCCPYGQPGDRLWVREAWASVVDGPYLPEHYIYRADGNSDWAHGWKPSIHMPRIASRITLEVTDVRLERLQDISEADAIAEGIEADVQPGDPAPLWRNYATGNTTICPIYSYQTLWELINGPGSWDANPFVWVVSFRRI